MRIVRNSRSLHSVRDGASTCIASLRDNRTETLLGTWNNWTRKPINRILRERGKEESGKMLRNRRLNPGWQKKKDGVNSLNQLREALIRITS